MMNAVACFVGRLRAALRPVEETAQERGLADAIDSNLRAAERGGRAARALEEAATLVKDHAHARRR